LVPSPTVIFCESMEAVYGMRHAWPVVGHAWYSSTSTVHPRGTHAHGTRAG
jgi:hypothetical protein